MDTSSLSKSVKGDVITPDAPGYSDALKRWAKNAERKAAIIVFVKDEPDPLFCPSCDYKLHVDPAALLITWYRCTTIRFLTCLTRIDQYGLLPQVSPVERKSIVHQNVWLSCMCYDLVQVRNVITYHGLLIKSA